MLVHRALLLSRLKMLGGGLWMFFNVPVDWLITWSQSPVLTGPLAPQPAVHRVTISNMGFASEWYDKRVSERPDEYVQLWGWLLREMVVQMRAWEVSCVNMCIWKCSLVAAAAHICVLLNLGGGFFSLHPHTFRKPARSESPAQPRSFGPRLLPSQRVCVRLRGHRSAPAPRDCGACTANSSPLATGRLKDDESCQRLLISLQLSNMNNGRWDWVTWMSPRRGLLGACVRCACVCTSKLKRGRVKASEREAIVIQWDFLPAVHISDQPAATGEHC